MPYNPKNKRSLRSNDPRALPEYLRVLKNSKLVTLSFIPEKIPSGRRHSSSPHKSASIPTVAKVSPNGETPAMTEQPPTNATDLHSNSTEVLEPQLDSGKKLQMTSNSTTDDQEANEELKKVKSEHGLIALVRASHNGTSDDIPSNLTLHKQPDSQQQKEERHEQEIFGTNTNSSLKTDSIPLDPESVKTKAVISSKKLRKLVFQDLSNEFDRLRSYTIDNAYDLQKLENQWKQDTIKISQVLRSYRAIYKNLILKKKEFSRKKEKLQNIDKGQRDGGDEDAERSRQEQQQQPRQQQKRSRNTSPEKSDDCDPTDHSEFD